MCCSRLVSLSVWLWLGLSVTTVEAVQVTLVNGSTNSVLWVSNWVGQASCPAGGTMKWEVGQLVDVAYGYDSTEVGEFQASTADGDYWVYLSNTGASVFNRTDWSTYWWWFGITVGFVWEFSGLGARWVRQLITGGPVNE